MISKLDDNVVVLLVVVVVCRNNNEQLDFLKWQNEYHLGSLNLFQIKVFW